MAEIGHLVYSSNTNESTTSATYQTITTVDLTGTLLDAQKSGSAEFFLAWFGGITNTSTTTTDCKARVHDGTSTLTASQMEMETSNSSNHQLIPYMYIDKRTLAASSATYAAEYASNGTATTFVRQWQSMALNLDDLGASNYAWDEDDMTAGSKGTNVDKDAWVDGASITIGDGTSDWLVFFTAHWIYDSASDVARTQLDVGGAPRVEVSDESSNSAGQGPIGNATVLKALASSTTVKVQVRNTTGEVNDCDNTRIFAVKLNAFEDHFSAYTDGTNVTHTTANTEQEADSINKVTSTGATRDWFMLGACNLAALCSNSNSTQAILREKIDAAAENTVSGRLDDGTANWRPHDASDVPNLPQVLFGDVSSVANGSTLNAILDVRCDAKSGNNYTTDDVALAAFTFELAAAPTNETVYPFTGPWR